MTSLPSSDFWHTKIDGLLYGLGLSAEENRSAQTAFRLSEASDRALFDRINPGFAAHQILVRHLLSGRSLEAAVPSAEALKAQLESVIAQHQSTLSEADLQQQFWWLWRCLPEIITQSQPERLLSPSSVILPDVSLWSQASLTAAMAGALAGYTGQTKSHPYLATFSFTPVQDVIKASRKTRDFWAGSWVLHYLSAKICWKLAQQYGPDSFIYPSLFQQPIIDHWLRQQWPSLADWIQPQPSHKLLTAGFPNVIVMVLPHEKVNGAMQTARQILQAEWLRLGEQVYHELHDQRHWMSELEPENRTWNGWLRHQWQPYWTAMPVGNPSQDLEYVATGEISASEPWLIAQNNAYGLNGHGLFNEAEQQWLAAIANETQPVEVNVGSWWPYLFDQLRAALASVKNARVWKLPTAFGPRSTISGFGPVVYPYPQGQQKNLTEKNTASYWGDRWETESDPSSQRERAGLFDGREQLNATETVKRGLHKIIGAELAVTEEEIAAAYPDLTAGVAGYLKVHREAEAQNLPLCDPSHNPSANRRGHFYLACNAIVKEFPWAMEVSREMRCKWGIPWIDERRMPRNHHSRMLNSGWLVEDAESDELDALRRELQQAINANDSNEIESNHQKILNLKREYREGIRTIIQKYYPNNNPADWYVLAAGDGDGMRRWLKGELLKHYKAYTIDEIPGASPTLQAAYRQLQDIPKRMGPSTHHALSRALLDFSNQLVPYLTEQRYAGRLIYSGGDDVLAYTNLWEWDRWLWDIRECFRGAEDPREEFTSSGDYWQRRSQSPNASLPQRPLFTMGQKATVSFGITLAHQSVPLAIALENLWQAEESAKQHVCQNLPDKHRQKDAVQVRILYSNGNILKSTAKFAVFHAWQQLILPSQSFHSLLSSALFEQAVQLWQQHPAPMIEALTHWTAAFCDRRETFSNSDSERQQFQEQLHHFLQLLWEQTDETDRDREIQNWLKLAAFTLRNRDITVRVPQEMA